MFWSRKATKNAKRKSVEDEGQQLPHQLPRRCVGIVETFHLGIRLAQHVNDLHHLRSGVVSHGRHVVSGSPCPTPEFEPLCHVVLVVSSRSIVCEEQILEESEEHRHQDKGSSALWVFVKIIHNFISLQNVT